MTHGPGRIAAAVGALLALVAVGCGSDVVHDPRFDGDSATAVSSGAGASAAGGAAATSGNATTEGSGETSVGSASAVSSGMGPGAGGAGASTGEGGFGTGGQPADGASTECQLLASVGVWYDQPQGNDCTECIRDISGQEGMIFTSCSTVGNTCLLDSSCHDIWICLSAAEYAMPSFDSCVAQRDANALALFKAMVDCVLPWCGAPDKCAYSGDTPGCTLDAQNP